MIITCQECDSRFVLDDKLIKPTGSKVRCSSCKHVFTVFPETAAPSPEEPPTLTPEPTPVAPPPTAQTPRNLDEGDDLAEELDRELDRLFGPDDGEGLFEEPRAEDPPPAVPAPEPEAPLGSMEEINLDDLDLDDLGLAEESEAVAPDELDLSDLDLDLSLDDEQPPALTTGGEAVEEELDFSDLGLSLDLDEEGAPEAAGPEAEAPVFDADLDFSDLALSLDDSTDDAGLMGDAEELSLSLDDGEVESVSLGGTGELDLSLDDGPVESAGFGPADAEEGLLEFDLDLDLDEDEPMQGALEGTLDEELDLSELEGLLQEEPAAGESAVEDDDIELELDFDYQADQRTEEMEPLSKESLDDSDFSDIEAMLEKDDKPLDVAADIDGELDLDLELDLAPEVEAVAAAPLDVKGEPAVALAEGVMEEPEGMPSAASRERASRTFAAGKDRGSGLRIFLTILLLVSLLFAILVGIYAMRDEIRDKTGIAIPTIAVVEKAREQVAALGIPGLSDWVRPAVKDPDGNLNLVTQDVAGQFVTSPTLGDLFVITGKVRNNYRTTRHSILLMGRLFTTDNREVQGKEFYAGNVMSDEELATLTMEQIDQRLKTSLGNENINARIRPGQLVPFMVVFVKLPDDLAEFAVEVRGSQEGVAIK